MYHTGRIKLKILIATMGLCLTTNATINCASLASPPGPKGEGLPSITCVGGIPLTRFSYVFTIHFEIGEYVLG